MKVFLFLVGLVYLYLVFRTGHIIYFIIAFALFCWWFYEYKKEMTRLEEQIEKESIEKVEKIPHTRYILSSDYLRAMIIDENENMFYLAERKVIDDEFEEKQYSSEELFEVAIVEDGQITSLISKGGVDGWSLINSGTNAKATKKETKKAENEEEVEEEVKKQLVKKLSIQLVVNDLSNPMIEYVFMEDPEGIEKDCEEYKELLKECKSWHRKFTVIMKRNEKVPVANWT